MNRRFGWVAAALLLVAGLLLGIGGVESPQVVMPLVLEFALLLLITAFLLRRVDPLESRRWMAGLLAVALFARVTALVLVHFVLTEAFFAPDSAGYREYGLQIAAHWRGAGPLPVGVQDTWQVAYPYVNAAFTWLLGDPVIAASTLNVFAGTWAALFTYLIARDLVHETAGRVAGGLVAVFPSMVLWSVINIRDALATMAVTFVVLMGVRVYREAQLRHLLLLFAGLALVVGLRDYMAFLLLAGLVLGFLAATRPGRAVQTISIGLVLVLAAAYLTNQLGVFQSLELEQALEGLSDIRRGMQRGAGSAFGQGFETETLGGALRFLPVGISYLLFAPFPWSITSTLQLVTLPEVILWYLLFPFFLIGALRSTRKGEGDVLIVLAVLVVTIVTYALVEGNFGTAYRHRAQITPLLFVFVGAGLVDSIQSWRARREARRRNQRMAVESLHMEEAMRSKGPES